jgi:hypothetical protein
MDLDLKVFGEITLKEIIGSEPPLEPDMKDKMSSELALLQQKLEGKNQLELNNLYLKQKELQKIVNRKPGSMALSQSKISLFNEHTQKYLQEIDKKLTKKTNNHVH